MNDMSPWSSSNDHAVGIKYETQHVTGKAVLFLLREYEVDEANSLCNSGYG